MTGSAGALEGIRHASAGGTGELKVKRVVPSYVQVADQLREAILRNEVATGDRLPSEAALVQLFGVGRSTVREALRVLTSEGLLVSKRGVNGGTFVVRPETGQVEDWFGTSVGRLASANQLTTAEVLEAWELVEIPTAELASRRRTAEQADTLKQLSLVEVEPGQEAAVADASRRFHEVLYEASGNRLVPIISRPLGAVFRSMLSRTDPTSEFWSHIQAEHLEIAEAVAAQDDEAAREAITRHVRSLVSWYNPA